MMDFDFSDENGLRIYIATEQRIRDYWMAQKNGTAPNPEIFLPPHEWWPLKKYVGDRDLFTISDAKDSRQHFWCYGTKIFIGDD